MNFLTKKHLIYGLSVIVIAVVSYRGYSYYQVMHHIDFFKQQIALYDEPAISGSLGDYRAQYFQTLVRYDPMYGLPGVDLDDWSESVRLLEQSRQEIIDLNNYDDSRQDNIKQYLYPTDFLRKQGIAERLRRDYIDNPTGDMLGQYFDAVDAVVTSYERYVADSIEIFSSFDQYQVSLYDSELSFATGGTDLTHFTQTLESYLSETKRRYNIISQDRECFGGIIESCRPVVTPMRPVVPTMTSADNWWTNDMRNRYYIIDNLRSKGPTDGYPYDVPVLVLDHSSCLIDSDPIGYYMWWRKMPGTEAGLFRPDLINDIYAVDLNEGYMSDIQFSKRYRALGGPRYKQQPVSQHYTCLDWTDDLVELGRMMFVLDIVRPDVIAFGNVGVYADIYRQVVALEDVDVVTQQHTADIMASLYDIANSKDISLDQQKIINDWLLVYRLGTYRYDEMLSSLVINNNAVKEYVAFDIWDFYRNIFMARNTYPLLLEGLNPSVLSENRSFLAHRFFQDTGLYVSYNHKLQEYFTVQQYTDMLLYADQVEFTLLDSVGLSRRPMEN